MESLLQNFVYFFTFTHAPLEVYWKSATRDTYMGPGTWDPGPSIWETSPGTRNPGSIGGTRYPGLLRGTQDLGPSN